MKRFATRTIIIFALIGSMGLASLIPVANAYSLYPTTDTSSSLNMNMNPNFDNFNVASGLDQLAAPFQNFVASAQSDTIAFVSIGPANIIQSTTMPFINASMQNYLGQASDWLYGTIGAQVSNFIVWLRQSL